jgi:hypothetical protein
LNAWLKGQHRRQKVSELKKSGGKEKQQTIERLNAMKNKKYAVLGIFAVVAAAFLIFGSPVQSQPKGGPQMQLGGGFIGSGNGLIFDALQVPLDPAGRTAALHLKVHTWSAPLAGLLNSFGADALTESIGEVEMTGRDTFKLSWIAYLIKQGNPPVITGIMVLTGEAQFTGPESYVIVSNFDVYPTTADADKDGFPDPGTYPLFSTATPNTNYARRVPIP